MKEAKKKADRNAESGEVVKFDEAGMPSLDVWLEDETIWLTQKQMGLLFGCAPQNITYHLREIFKIGEFDTRCKVPSMSTRYFIRSCPHCLRTANR